MGLTLFSCGGGGGGSDEQNLTGNDDAGMENTTNASTAEIDYAPASKSEFSSLSFGPYTITNPNTVKATHLSGIYLGYSYKKLGKNMAEISISGTQTQTFQASATLSNGRFYYQNYPNTPVLEVDATLTVEFLNKSEIKVTGYEDRTRYTYTTQLLNLIQTGESTSSSTYNTTGTWR